MSNWLRYPNINSFWQFQFLLNNLLGTLACTYISKRKMLFNSVYTHVIYLKTIADVDSYKVFFIKNVSTRFLVST